MRLSVEAELCSTDFRPVQTDSCLTYLGWLWPLIIEKLYCQLEALPPFPLCLLPSRTTGTFHLQALEILESIVLWGLFSVSVSVQIIIAMVGFPLFADYERN